MRQKKEHYENRIIKIAGSPVHDLVAHGGGKR
jgi:hypothetical protein